MLFNTFAFFAFFFFVYVIYWKVKHRNQNHLLLLASYFFYGCWDWRFLSLIMISTVVDYFCGLKVYSATEQKIKKKFVAISVIVNLSFLGFFKYFNFFAESLTELTSVFGYTPSWFELNVILPVGISFYTFQTMTYTIDIYRKQLKPTHHFFDFALFVSFFPQLVAGPIERASNLLPQVLKSRKFSWEQTKEGAWLVIWGLFKKVYVADNLAVLVDKGFNNYASLTAPEICAVLIAFSFQIYCDFSGYTDIARGISKLLGFELRLNFNLPYFARNPSDFWRRWHISLSTWLRDYLYIPLGGSRKGEVRTYINLMATMVLGGLWHGAAWTFVIWGFYQGALLCLHRFFSPLVPFKNNIFTISLSVFLMYVFACYGWLIFRADSFEQIHVMTQGLFFGWNLGAQNLLGMYSELLMYIWPVLLVQVWQMSTGKLDFFYRLPILVRDLIIAVIIYLIFVYGSSESQGFIYFQF
ncbi:MAG: MBOAT family O-acyltransferase [Cellvibrionaceae bacterium]